MYIATVALRSDKKEKSWQPGDVVKDSDFPKKVISAWLQQGILEREQEEVDEEELLELPEDELHIEDGE